ncbi:hypothetical protein JMJ56_21825 [Belnapia sp. T18]|uniref:Error-prone DNA polymerase n=1 Tax=Belnapia arida TaxID=2804533 RepID=A0ABS1U7J8_9PROT|nr:hypothetical protein [Belnapia arida]MBL6080661.1 hypothetical protein [Belnapia arida]
MSLPEDVTGALASQVWGWSEEGVIEEHATELNLDPADRRLRLTLELARELIGFPRQLGTHPSGFVLTRDQLDELVRVAPAAMAGRQIVEWNKDDIDALGFMKVDVLGLGMLGCLRRAFELLEDHKGQWVDIASVPPEDPATYAMVRRADTLGTSFDGTATVSRTGGAASLWSNRPSLPASAALATLRIFTLSSGFGWASGSLPGAV